MGEIEARPTTVIFKADITGLTHLRGCVLDFITCEYVIVIADRDHAHGHPHNVVMERFEEKVCLHMLLNHGHIVLKVDKEETLCLKFNMMFLHLTIRTT